jgi:CHAT domain-containing protein
MNRLMKVYLPLLYSLFIACGLSLATHADEPVGEKVDESIVELRDQGTELYQQGRYEDAIETWQQALEVLHLPIRQNHPLADIDKHLHIDLHRRLAIAEQVLGFNDRAEQSLQDARALIQQAETSPAIEMQASQVLGQLGDLALGDSRWQQAGQYLGESVARALALQHPPTSARALNKLGNALTLAGNYDKALVTYTRGLQLAQSSSETALANTLCLNLIRLYLKPDWVTPDAHWRSAYDLFRQVATSPLKPLTLAKAGDLIALALLGQKLQQHPGLAAVAAQDGETADHLSASIRWLLLAAADIAKGFNDPHYQAYAHGYLGQLDEARGNYQEALQQTEQALSFADRAQDPTNLYLWQWQLGRLYRAQGQIAAAITAYRQAVATLNPVRSMLMNSGRSATNYEQRIRPVYFGLADLLLMQASQLAAEQQATGGNGDRVQQRPVAQQVETAYQAELTFLHEARDTVEILKAAELQDYFQDECTVALQAKQTPLDAIDPHSAIIYPIILPQRLVLLLSIQGRLQQVVVPLAAADLKQTVRRFRRHLQTRASYAYLRESRQLYDWLIRPLQPYLQATTVDTLVFVPDGALRTIPFATLQNKEDQQFLIQRYAVAMTPSLSLTDPRPFWRKEMAPDEDMAVLIAGLSEGVQGFSPLPSVPRELRTVQSLLGGDILQDQDYSTSNLSEALQATEYGVLHLATHGVFGGSDEHSFLLTHDGRLNMSQLGELLRVGIFREQPLELLTLSACQTALGDERSALGLAGVAVQSGARSAIASLWFVDDAATATLMSEFYQQLSKRKLSKARALQNAQLSLLKQARYRHPIYWGPYLLIGNWL